MATARSRINKGRRYQKTISDKLKEAFGLTDDDIRPAIGSETGPDIILMSDLARKKVGLAIECKNQKSLSLWKSLEQTCGHCKNKKGKGLDPALIFKRGEGGTHRSWICIELDDWIDLKKRAGDLR
jgi:hypothetical protein